MFELTTNQMTTLLGKEEGRGRDKEGGGGASPLRYLDYIKTNKRCLKECLSRSSILEKETNEDIHECPVNFNDEACCACSLNQMHQML